MTAPKLSLRHVKRTRLAMCRRIPRTSRASGWRTGIAISVAAGTFSIILVGTPSYGQTRPVSPIAGERVQGPATINAATVSCKELKEKLDSAGTLNIVAEQRGWGDTFYGPGVPQCQFWSKPMFSYVNAKDGYCGAGYVCVDRVTGGR